jgi:autotransporter-associated beta strand protein
MVEALECRLAPATFTWTGAGTTNNWSDPNNWSTHAAPTAGASLIFPTGALQLSSNNNLNGATTPIASITISGGGYSFSGNQLDLSTNGSITDTSGVAGNTIAFNILFGAVGSKFTVNEFFLVSAGGNLNVTGALSTSFTTALTIGSSVNRGEVTLAGNNSTFTGTIGVNQGSILSAANSNALGSSTSTTTVQNGAQLQLSGGVTVANPLLLNGSGIHADGALLNEAGNNTWAGTIVFNTNGPTYIGATTGTTLTVTGLISDQGNPDSLTKEGFGTLVLDPKYLQTSPIQGNTYRGGTTINGGVLVVENSLALGQPASGSTTTNITVATGTAEAGELELNYVNQGSSFYDPNLISVSGTPVGFSVPTKYHVTLNGQGNTGDPYISNGLTGTYGSSDGRGGHGALYNAAGNNSWEGEVTLYSTDTIASAYPTVGINVAQGTTFTIDGVIDDKNLVTDLGEYFFNVEGLGTLVFTNANTTTGSFNNYTGATVITEGTLIVESSDALGISNDLGVIIDSGGTFGLEADAVPDYVSPPTGVTKSATDLCLPSNISITTEISPYFTSLPGSINDPVIENIDGTNQILGLITIGQWNVNQVLSTPLKTVYNQGGSTIFDVLADPNPLTNTYNSFSQLTLGGILPVGGLNVPVGGIESFPAFNFGSDTSASVGSADNPASKQFYDLIKEGYGQLVLPIDNIPDVNNPSLYPDFFSGEFLPSVGFEGNVYIYQGWITTRTDDALGGFIQDIGQENQPVVTVAPYGNVVGQVNKLPAPTTPQSSGAALMLLPYEATTLDPSDPNFADYGPNLTDIPQNFSLTGIGLDPSNYAQSSYLPTPFADMGALENLSGDNTITGNILFNNAGTPGAGPGIGVELLPDSSVLNHHGPNPVGGSPDWDVTTSQLTLQGLQSDNGNDGQSAPGFAGFTKVGTNELIIQGDGTYSGNVNINAGVLEIQNDTALGSGLGTTFVSAGTALVLGPTIPYLTGGIQRGIQVRGETLSLSQTSNSINFAQFSNGGTVFQFNTLTVLGTQVVNGATYVGGDSFWDGAVILATNATIDLRPYADPNTTGQTDTSRLTIQGVISDAPNVTGSVLTLDDTGSLALAGANTYRGGTDVDQGIIIVENSQALGAATSPVVVLNGAALQLEGNLSIANPLSISGQGPGAAPNVQDTWFAQGPAAINSGSTNGNQNWGGPVVGIVSDPNDPDVIYITTAGGGAWKTTDGGVTWHPLIDVVPAMSLALQDGEVLDDNTTFTGAIAMDPTNPNIIYVGLGNANNTADAFYGDGILYTTDGGKTWSFMTPPTAFSGGSAFAGQTISQIVVDPGTQSTDNQPDNSSSSSANITIFVAVSGAPQNGGSGGINATSGNSGIWEFGPAFFGSGYTWTNLTAGQQTLDSNSLGSKVTFTSTDDYTSLVVIDDPSPANDYGNFGTELGFDSSLNGGRLFFFSVGTPDATDDASNINGVYFCDFPIDPATYLTELSFTTNPDFWLNAGFPVSSGSTRLDLGQIKLAYSGTTQNLWPTESLLPPPALQEVVYAAIAYSDSATSIPPPGGPNFAGQLQTVEQATLTFNFTTGLWALGWANIGKPSNANSGLPANPFGVPETQDWDQNMAIAAAVPSWAGGTGDVYLDGWGASPGSTIGGPWYFNGSSWNAVSAGSSVPQTGAHSMAFDANGNLLIGTDGGIWELSGSAKAPGTSWLDLNGANFALGNLANSLQIAEINGLGQQNPLNPLAFVGGTQWNGTDTTAGTYEWAISQAGSGGTIQVDPSDPSFVYLSSGTEIYQSTDGGNTWKPIYTTQQTNAQFVVDDLNPARLLVSDSEGLLFPFIAEITNPGTSSQQEVSLFLPFTDPAFTTAAVAIAGYQGTFVNDPGFPDVSDQVPSSADQNTLYVADSLGGVWVTKDNGLTWVERDASLPTAFDSGTGQISDIVVDPRDRDVAYVTYSNFSGTLGGAQVYMTTDAGQNWTPILGGALPDLPIYSLVIDPRQGTVYNPTLYLGTDDGVYVRNTDPSYDPTLTVPIADSFDWQKLGIGLPSSQVRTLVLNTADNSLSAGTYGRGVFEIWLSNPTSNLNADAGGIQVISGNSTWSGNITLTAPPTSGTPSSPTDNLYISVDGSQSLQSTIGTTSLTISGIINDNATTTDVPVGITITGGGTLTLSGDNTYQGETIVQAGVLDVQNPDALGGVATSTPSAVIVDAGAALYLQSDLIDTPVTLFGDGFEIGGHFNGALLNYTGDNVYTGTLTLGSSSTIGAESGTQLTIGATGGAATAITDNSNGYNLTKELAGTLAITTADTYSGNTYVNQGILSVQNSGALGTNASSIVEVLDGSQLQLQSPIGMILSLIQSLYISGTGAQNDGALLNVSGNNIWAGSVWLTSLPAFSTSTAGQQEVYIGVAQGTSGAPSSLKISGDLEQSLNPPVPPTIPIDQPPYVVNPQSFQDFTLDKVGLGVLILSHNNNDSNGYDGGTNVLAGTLDVQANWALGPGGSGSAVTTTVSNGATLELDNSALTPSGTGLNVQNQFLVLDGMGDPNLVSGNSQPGALYNLVGNNTWTAPAPISGQDGITLGNNGATNDGIGAAASTFLTLTGTGPVIAGSSGASLRNIDSGVVVLGSHVNYTGSLFVDSGTLDDDGTLGAVTLNGGTLEGTGNVGAVTATATGGSIGGGDGSAPGGNPAGILTASSVTLNNSSTLLADLTGRPGNPGTTNSQLLVNGVISLGTATIMGGSAVNTIHVNDSFTVAHTTGNNAITGSLSPNPVFLNGLKFGITTQQHDSNPADGWDVILTRLPASATMTLVSSTSPSTTSAYGYDVTFTATVSPEGGAILSSDYVWFTLQENTPTNQTLITQRYVQLNDSDQATIDPQAILGSALVPGQYTVTADFNSNSGSNPNYDPNFAADVMATPWNQTVQVAPTAISFSTSDASAVYSEPVTITATVSTVPASSAIPTGTVTFYLNGSTFTGSSNIAVNSTNGTAQVTLPNPLNAGTYTIDAVYTTDNSSFFSNDSTLVSGPHFMQTIGAEGTTITGNGSPANSPNPSNYGAPVTFSVVVSPNSPGTAYPLGQTVTFVEGSTTLGTTTVGTGGVASFTTSALPVGANQTILAEFAGSSNFQASSNFSFTQTVSTGTTSTSLSETDSTTSTTSSGPTANSGYGDNISFTATVTTPGETPTVKPGANTAGGFFTFTIMQGSTTIATQTIQVNSSTGKATYTPAPTLLAVGSYTVSATYNQNGLDPNFSSSTASLTQIVGLGNVNMTLVPSPASTTYGGSETFTATVTPGGASVGNPSASATVTFTIDQGTGSQIVSSAIPVQSNGTAQFSISTLTGGTHSVLASYSGNASFGSNSKTISFVVSTKSTTTTVTSSSLSVGYGSSVTFTAAVTPLLNSPWQNPTGTFTFYINGTPQSQTASPNSTTGKGSITVSGLAVGSYSVYAIYSGDTNYTQSTSATITQKVVVASTQTNLSGQTGSAAPYGTAAILATVVNTSSSTPTPTTGSVTFTIKNTTTSVTSTVVVNLSGSNVAALPTLNLHTGTNNITAVYGGSANFAASATSAQVTQVVTGDATGTSLATSLTPGPYGEPIITATVVNNQSGSTAAPTGTVSFYLNGSTTAYATVTLTSGQAVLTPALNVGSYTITAKYNPANTDFTTSSTTSSLSQSITAAGTAISLSPSTTMPAQGQSIVLTATVTPSFVTQSITSNGTAPTGTVVFKDTTTNTTLGSVTLTAAMNGVAKLTTSALTSLGSHTLSATFTSNSSNYTNPSQPATTMVTVSQPNLVITTIPSSVLSGTAFTVVVTYENALGQTVTNFTGAVTVALFSGPSGGHLTGTLSVNAVAGVATFSTLKLDKLVQSNPGYVLSFSAANTATVNSGNILVQPSVINTTVTVGTSVVTQVAPNAQFSLNVTMADILGNLGTFSGPVSISLVSSTSGGTLSGTTSYNLSSPVSSFSFTGLSFSRIGTYTIKVTVGGVSKQITIVCGSRTVG